MLTVRKYHMYVVIFWNNVPAASSLALQIYHFMKCGKDAEGELEDVLLESSERKLNV
jgi:hypothetical protein